MAPTVPPPARPPASAGCAGSDPHRRLLAPLLAGLTLALGASAPAAPLPRPPAAAAAGAAAGSGPSPLPCPLTAGWEVVALERLPRRESSGRPIGGFSALRHHGGSDRLELLSDAPRGMLSRWQGLAAWIGRPVGQASPPLRPAGLQPLLGGAGEPLPQAIDGEGMEHWRGGLWLVSEGRRTPDRPAQLLRFSAAGTLEQALTLPPAWQPGPGHGLGANQGPESLALLRRPGGGEALLMAAERPLLQDPPDRVRLLEWRAVPPAGPAAAAPASLMPGELRPLALPRRGAWGLTELLPVPAGRPGPRLLALLRRFEFPDSWTIRLSLYPLPPPAGSGPEGGGEGGSPMAPLHSWTLASGSSGNGSSGSGAAAGEGRQLPADNWEGLAAGPLLADGRPSLLLVSDDNFNPLQESWLAVLAPRRGAGCLMPGS